MMLRTPSSPHVHARVSVTQTMLFVAYALVPGVAAYVYFFGWGVLITAAWCSVVALLAEAAILSIRRRPMKMFITDGSVLVTAVLLALSLPPYLPWWIAAIGTLFAVVVAKHLYGGLGFNPFNPAMVGYAVLLVSFPKEMTTWYLPLTLDAPVLSVADSARLIFYGALPPNITVDALTSATPLDWLRTQIHLEKTVKDVTNGNPLYGALGGVGWEWVNGGFLLGGIWLLYRKTIQWHIPIALLATLASLSMIAYLIAPTSHPPPLFTLFSGATMLGAFFIATDPVTSSTTPRGRLIFGAGVGAFIFIIRNYGGYPDAVAFAVLLMNTLVPLIDQHTQPRVYGHNPPK